MTWWLAQSLLKGLGFRGAWTSAAALGPIRCVVKVYVLPKRARRYVVSEYKRARRYVVNEYKQAGIAVDFVMSFHSIFSG